MHRAWKEGEAARGEGQKTIVARFGARRVRPRAMLPD